MHLARHRAEGPFTTTFYSDRASAADRAAGSPPQRPVWAIAPESLIVAPTPDAVVRVAERTEIWGWAWSFRGIAGVEVGVDGGASYVRVALDERRGWPWQRFSLHWTPVEQGEALLQVRASEAAGATQPREDARNAMHVVPIVVR
jgi:Mo-co oxidoreductase dimerisation domain